MKIKSTVTYVPWKSSSEHGRFEDHAIKRYNWQTVWYFIQTNARDLLNLIGPYCSCFGFHFLADVAEWVYILVHQRICIHIKLAFHLFHSFAQSAISRYYLHLYPIGNTTYACACNSVTWHFFHMLLPSIYNDVHRSLRLTISWHRADHFRAFLTCLLHVFLQSPSSLKSLMLWGFEWVVAVTTLHRGRYGRERYINCSVIYIINTFFIIDSFSENSDSSCFI